MDGSRMKAQFHDPQDVLISLYGVYKATKARVLEHSGKCGRVTDSIANKRGRTVYSLRSDEKTRVGIDRGNTSANPYYERSDKLADLKRRRRSPTKRAQLTRSIKLVKRI
ncbi:hypothetical protein ACTXT7_003682 [Hymenolepis weldensis]